MSDRRDDPRPVTIWTPGEGEPVPRHKRNARRGYDAEGREIAPANIANSRQNGARGILVSCKCGHDATLPFDGLVDTAFVPDVALRLRCSACGGGAKGIETGPDFTGRAGGERYRDLRRRTLALVRSGNLWQSWNTSPTSSQAAAMTPKDVTEDDLTVGARVGALRKIRGASQTALGEAIGVSFQQVGKYETGQNRIGAVRLQEIAKFFDVPLSVLFGDDAEPVEATGDFAFLGLPGAVELLKAFAAIENTQLRRDVLALARTAASISAGPYAGNA